MIFGRFKLEALGDRIYTNHCTTMKRDYNCDNCKPNSNQFNIEVIATPTICCDKYLASYPIDIEVI